MYATARWAGKLTTDQRPTRLARFRAPNIRVILRPSQSWLLQTQIEPLSTVPQARFLKGPVNKARRGTIGASRGAALESRLSGPSGADARTYRGEQDQVHASHRLCWSLRRTSSRGCRDRGQANP
jgi:hypothetical protein